MHAGWKCLLLPWTVTHEVTEVDYLEVLLENELNLFLCVATSVRAVHITIYCALETVSIIVCYLQHLSICSVCLFFVF